tara:strand:+ start:4698 stop:5654 length:957 start_codon:yes stop_codon:yes gene_type:complete
LKEKFEDASTLQSLWMPDQVSTIAPEVDSLFYFILYWVYFFLAIVVVGAIYFGWKYKSNERGTTQPLDHNNLLEITWTLFPLLLTMVVFFWGAKSYLKMNIVPYDAMEVNVKAQKWFFSFNYKEGFNSSELVVPVNRPVKLIMESQDVLHGFYVPDFRVKMDIIPNRYMVTWFEATKVGEYDILCTEYCGTAHSQMLAKVKVLNQEDYDEWLEKANVVDESIPLVELGEIIYNKNACNTCHSIDGSNMIGPSFKGIWNTTMEHTDGSKVLVDENYIYESIIEPQKKIIKGYEGVMPSYKGILRDREILGVVEYIKSLK